MRPGVSRLFENSRSPLERSNSRVLRQRLPSWESLCIREAAHLDRFGISPSVILEADRTLNGRETPFKTDPSPILWISGPWQDQPELLRFTVMTSSAQPNSLDATFIRQAYLQALKSYEEGGLPIGAVMTDGHVVIAEGHNRRVQDGDPIAHGEMDCFRKAGRRSRYDTVTLYTTLSPCMMCAGAIVQFGVKRVVVGEDVNFPGNISFLRSRGVDVTLLSDPECLVLMKRFIAERPELWDEDIAGRTNV
jgi:creatinine deaminase